MMEEHEIDEDVLDLQLKYRRDEMIGAGVGVVIAVVLMVGFFYGVAAFL